MAALDQDLAGELGRRFYRVLASPEGQELLAHLKQRFYDCDLRGATPEETAFNLGRRELVRALLTGARLLTTKQE